MSSLKTLFVTAGGLAALALIAGPPAAATCAPKNADPMDAVHRMYDGLMAGDRAKTLAVFDPEAFFFDGGARFTPGALTDLILKAEAAGATFQWGVEGAGSHTACDLAWATWTNHGSVTTASGTDPKTWLESAVFVWRDKTWKIRFFHSTPVLTAQK